MKHVAFGFRSFCNYRVRAPLYASKPNWDLLATIRLHTNYLVVDRTSNTSWTIARRRDSVSPPTCFPRMWPSELMKNVVGSP